MSQSLGTDSCHKMKIYDQYYVEDGEEDKVWRCKFPIKSDYFFGIFKEMIICNKKVKNRWFPFHFYHAIGEEKRVQKLEVCTNVDGCKLTSYHTKQHKRKHQKEDLLKNLLKRKSDILKAGYKENDQEIDDITNKKKRVKRSPIVCNFNGCKFVSYFNSRNNQHQRIHHKIFQENFSKSKADALKAKFNEYVN